VYTKIAYFAFSKQRQISIIRHYYQIAMITNNASSMEHNDITRTGAPTDTPITGSETQHPAWWKAMLERTSASKNGASENGDSRSGDSKSGDSKSGMTRREATAHLASLAAMAGVTLGVGVTLTSCGNDDVETESDTLEVQKKQGWNVGHDDAKVDFQYSQDTDSVGKTDWQLLTKSDALMKAWQPSAKWQPYYVPTLIQSLSQESLRKQIKPVYSPSAKEAYSRGLGMRELLKTSKDISTTLLVVDIPGADAVAFAAAIADIAQPVITFDNYPHPFGVVPSHLTLGSLVYFANEITEKAAKRKADAPAVLVLDSSRLNPYVDDETKFDNRYTAKMPTAENLASLGIKSILYATPSESQRTELDDLNDDFATYQEKQIAVNMLPLDRFKAQPDTALAGGAQQASTATATLQTQQQTGMQSQAQGQQPQQQQNPANGTGGHYGGGYAGYAPPVYYYGGGMSMMPYFFMHYAMSYSYYRAMPSMGSMPASSFSRPAYQPARRATMFSSSSVGGSRSGIGRQRPSGFGRVAVRTNSSTGRFSGVGSSSSRSGSFGRSSFGGRSS
jgi:hypothetical protein